MPSRRAVLAGGAVLLLPAARRADDPRTAAIRAIERRSGGRLGVAFRDIGSGVSVDWRGDEQFPMCSTFKLPLAAAVLAQVDAGRETLDRTIAVTAADVLGHSPVTAPLAGGPPPTVATLCGAAVVHSDNTAANLLLATIGGPAGLTHFLRKHGDRVTRLDRNEPSLNTAIPGDPRDTTTPAAMLDTTARLLFGTALSAASRARLTEWLRECDTGTATLRAGFPNGWSVGDKTGAGARGTRNDVAIAWPPGRAPILIAAYLTGSTLDEAGRDAVLADVARALTA